MIEYPKYEIIMTVDDNGNRKRPYSVLETIWTWNGPRTYIRQRGFSSITEAQEAIRAKKGERNGG